MLSVASLEIIEGWPGDRLARRATESSWRLKEQAKLNVSGDKLFALTPVTHRVKERESERMARKEDDDIHLRIE